MPGMNTFARNPDRPQNGSTTRTVAWSLVGLAGLVLLLAAWFRPLNRDPSGTGAGAPTIPNAGPIAKSDSDGKSATPIQRVRGGAFQPNAVQVVGRKLAEFANSRRAYAQALATRRNVAVPSEVNDFFDAVESGNWEKIETSFKRINGGDSSAGHADERSPAVQALWPAIIDAYGAAEQVHEWPAQKLLDYGNAILGALGPGMVYVGGTDNGRWVPELLNETSDGERHIVLTQNALADGSYLDYIRLQYDGQLSNLTEEDSQKAFQTYIEDARKRFEHDQQFPDEPKQLRPNEDIRMVNGKIEVGGQVAVMAINERLLRVLMDKNPDLSFALQESFPLRGTYPDAAPLGPLMELRATGGGDAFSEELASQTAAYWQSTAQSVLGDMEAAGSPTALKSWSHDINSAANLLAAHGYGDQAEQTYRLSNQLWPGNPEPVAALSSLLAGQGRLEEARALLQEFDRQFPDQRGQLESAGAWKLVMGK
jgi:hypothetical protein